MRRLADVVRKARDHFISGSGGDFAVSGVMVAAGTRKAGHAACVAAPEGVVESGQA
jgi:hypothetical protein